MTEMQAFEADRIGEALDAVERGETVIIKRDGRTVARVTPEVAAAPTERQGSFEALDRLRAEGRGIMDTTIEEALAWRHEGHKY